MNLIMDQSKPDLSLIVLVLAQSELKLTEIL